MKQTTYHILEFLEEWAPQSTKLEYDNVGLLVGNHHQQVDKVLVCLDVTKDVIDEAVAAKANLIISHHPLIFARLSRVASSDPTGSLIYQLIKNDISLVAAHTNLDAAHGGVSFVLADKLGLAGVQFLKEDKENGDCHNPSGHKRTSGFGAIGMLPEPVSVPHFLDLLQNTLSARGIRHAGKPDIIRKVAVCGGAGAFLADEARKQKADAFVTADLKYHDFFSGPPDCLFVDAGHYETEAPVIEALCNRLRDRFLGLEVISTSVNTNPVAYFFNK